MVKAGMKMAGCRMAGIRRAGESGMFSLRGCTKAGSGRSVSIPGVSLLELYGGSGDLVWGALPTILKM